MITQYAQEGDPADGKSDIRQSLVNECAIGTFQEIQVPHAAISALRGFRLDYDPPLLRSSAFMPEVPATPVELYERFLKPRLDRDPLLGQVEVLDTGGGVHVVVWFSESVVFDSDFERDRWQTTVELFGLLGPTDPAATIFGGLSRPIDSVNSKYGRSVSQLRQGTAVRPDDVLAFADRLSATPFRMVADFLFGPGDVTPCPLCETSTLKVYDDHGRCYHCKRVEIESLLGLSLPVEER